MARNTKKETVITFKKNHHEKRFHTYGNDETIMTTVDKPKVTTLEADPLTGSVAYLYVIVNPNWAATTVTFEYGLTASCGHSVTAN